MQKFAEIVSNHRDMCTFVNNEWHVPDYVGIQSTTGQISQSGWKASRSADGVRDPTSLGVLMQGGAKLVAASAQADARG